MSQAMIDSTVGQLVVDRPGRARVFEKFGIDYCCGGKKPLRLAIAEKKLVPETVLEALDREGKAAAATNAAPLNLATASMTDLCDHIERTHHAYLKEELPRLRYLTHKVGSRHGEHRPALVELYQTFLQFYDELMQHMAKEEQILFPICRRMDSLEPLPANACGSVNNPIAVMIKEHDDAGDALKKFRDLTDNYSLPADACTTYRALFDSLQQLERDMHQHVHTENNILFPKAARMEALLNR
jgi:regulator of cell morphogenesis and NO signaling